jgi:hypothetical protein
MLIGHITFVSIHNFNFGKVHALNYEAKCIVRSIILLSI